MYKTSFIAQPTMKWLPVMMMMYKPVCTCNKWKRVFHFLWFCNVLHSAHIECYREFYNVYVIIIIMMKESAPISPFIFPHAHASLHTWPQAHTVYENVNNSMYTYNTLKNKCFLHRIIALKKKLRLWNKQLAAYKRERTRVYYCYYECSNDTVLCISTSDWGVQSESKRKQIH